MAENLVLCTAVYENINDALDEFVLTSGEAGLIVVGEATLEKGFDAAVTRTAQIVKRSVDAATDELPSEVREPLRSEE